MKKIYTQEEIIDMYQKDLDIMKYAQQNNTGAKSRVEEIIGFGREAGYRRIGIAHCISVSYEAEIVKGMLEDQFEVFIVDCKVGNVPKKAVVGSGWGAVCNPILQAKVLNEEETDLNIVMGLCVGHDMIFDKHSKAPTTTLIVKDMRYGNVPNKGLSY